MRLLFNAVLIAGVIAFGLRFFGQPVLNVSAGMHAVTVDTISLEHLKAVIEHPRGDVRATILYIYTSWCPFCKMQNGTMERLAREQGPSGLQLIGLSIDKHAEDMEAYLSRQNQSAFSTYWMKEKTALAEYLRSHGSSFGGGIPHIVLFDRNGRFIREYGGVTGLDVLTNDAAKARSPAQAMR